MSEVRAWGLRDRNLILRLAQNDLLHAQTPFFIHTLSVQLVVFISEGVALIGMARLVSKSSGLSEVIHETVSSSAGFTSAGNQQRGCGL